MCLRPVSASASISRILSAVLIGPGSIWKPSRGPSSWMSALLGMSVIFHSRFVSTTSATPLVASLMPSCLPRRKDHADRLRLHLGWTAAAPMQVTAKMGTSVRGVVRDDVGARNGDPGATDQQLHHGLAVHDSLDEVGGRSAIPDVAARLSI